MLRNDHRGPRLGKYDLELRYVYLPLVSRFSCSCNVFEALYVLNTLAVSPSINVCKCLFMIDVWNDNNDSLNVNTRNYRYKVFTAPSLLLSPSISTFASVSNFNSVFRNIHIWRREWAQNPFFVFVFCYHCFFFFFFFFENAKADFDGILDWPVEEFIALYSHWVMAHIKDNNAFQYLVVSHARCPLHHHACPSATNHARLPASPPCNHTCPPRNHACPPVDRHTPVKT